WRCAAYRLASHFAEQYNFGADLLLGTGSNLRLLLLLRQRIDDQMAGYLCQHLDAGGWSFGQWQRDFPHNGANDSWRIQQWGRGHSNRHATGRWHTSGRRDAVGGWYITGRWLVAGGWLAAFGWQSAGRWRRYEFAVFEWRPDSLYASTLIF